jgi:hypothetical protein
VRKLIIAGFTAGLMALAIGPAFAGPGDPSGSGDCTGGPVNQSYHYQDTDSTGAPTGPSYDGAQVCTSLGSLTAAQGSDSPTSGFVVVDGNSSNPAPIGGYVGASDVDPAGAGNPGGVGVVASSCGNYQPGSAAAASPAPPQTSCP